MKFRLKQPSALALLITVTWTVAIALGVVYVAMYEL
jgi:hypothetical protein